MIRFSSLPPLISLWGLSILYFTIGSVNLYFITTREPSTYIDEIFHVDQCVKYCNGNFTQYNPKITTPPGLYLITVLVLKPLSVLTQRNLCAIHWFRSFNFTISICLFTLLYRIIDSKHQHSSNLKKLRIAINFATFPVLYFFSFFYYTDVTSTFLVLLTYHLYNIGRSRYAAIVGFLAVTVRQTNIVWFCYFAFVRCCRRVEYEASKSGRLVSGVERQKISYILMIIRECLYLGRHSFLHFASFVLEETYGFVFSAACFLYLVFKNGSLVFGDKSAHVSVIHVPQLLYFSLFISIFSFPLCIRPLFKFLRNIGRSKVLVTISTLVCAIIVATNTMAHLYLISDNRHYTFYIWKRVFEKPFGRYLLIPWYVVSIFCIFDNTSHVNSYTKLAYILSTAVCLVPQKLLEFRYFIVPYLLYRLETHHKLSQWQISLEFLFNALVNYATISLFIQKPFKWPDGTVQRFSW